MRGWGDRAARQNHPGTVQWRWRIKRRDRLFLLFYRCHIALQLIRIEKVGGKPKIIFLLPSRGIFPGVQPHTEIEVAVPELSLQRIDLQEVIGTEFDVAAYTVQAVGMLLER